MVYPLFLLKIVFFDEMKVIGDECAQVLRLFFLTTKKGNISVEFLFEVKKIFALKGQHKPARRNAAG
jgi:hypothetical protein